MFKSNYFVFLKKCLIPLLATVYLLNPLQQHILEEIHTISHLFAHTDFHHQHEDENHILEHYEHSEHSHEHKLIAYFTKIFSSEKEQDDHDGVFFNYTMDKHIAVEYPCLNFSSEIFHKHSFFFISKKYLQKTSISTPPPEYFFS